MRFETEYNEMEKFLEVFPKEIRHIIILRMIEPPYIMFDYIKRDRIFLLLPFDKYYINIEWGPFSANPAALWILLENPDKIDYGWFSSNPAAVDILRAKRSLIDWIWLSANPAAVDMIIANPKKMNWLFIQENPGFSKEFFEANMDKISWNGLSGNPL